MYNSARSQMAEAFLNTMAPDQLLAESAGLEPGTINPHVVEVMKELGIDLSGKIVRQHYSLEDPSSFQGSDEQIKEKTRKIRDKIKVKVETFIKKKSNYNVKEFHDWDSFYYFLKNKIPYLLTLDLKLPDADKLEICKYLRGTFQGSLNDFTASISHIQI